MPYHTYVCGAAKKRQNVMNKICNKHKEGNRTEEKREKYANSLTYDAPLCLCVSVCVCLCVCASETTLEQRPLQRRPFYIAAQLWAWGRARARVCLRRRRESVDVVLSRLALRCSHAATSTATATASVCVCVCCGEFLGQFCQLRRTHTHAHTVRESLARSLTHSQQQQCARSLCGRSQQAVAVAVAVAVFVCERDASSASLSHSVSASQHVLKSPLSKAASHTHPATSSCVAS